MQWAWLIPTYGFVAFGLISLFGRYLPGKGVFLSIVAIGAGFVTFLPVLFDMLAEGIPSGTGGYHFVTEWFTAGDITVGLGIIIDPLTIIMLGLVTFVAFFIQVYSIGYMRGDPRISWYFAVHSLFAASMLLLVLADNLLLLYVAWELVGLCSYLLIGFWWEKRSAAEAAKKAFITTRIGDVGLLIGILILVINTNTFDIGEILRQVTNPGPGEQIDQTVVWLSSLLIFFGAMGKSAQFPLHVWLPDAMEGPTPVSALIHAATMVVAGVFLVARLFPLFEASPNVQLTIAIIGITTALVGASMALVMTDMKRILAYSTMSHLGFMMLALGLGGYTAALFHLVTHAIAKAMLFLTAGNVMHAMHEETDITRMGGLRKNMPISAAAFTIGALALAGIPPLSGFWSKDEMLLAIQQSEFSGIFIPLFLIAAILSAIYMARMLKLAFFGNPSKESAQAHEAPNSMTTPIIVFGLLTLTIGFLVLPFGEFDGFGSFIYSHHIHEFKFDALWGTVGIILSIASFVFSWILYSNFTNRVDNLRIRFRLVHKFLVNKYYLDHIYQWAIDNISLRLATFVGLFDRVVINDTWVDGTGGTIVNAGRRIRAVATGKFYNYGVAMVIGVISLIILLRLGVGG